MRPLPRLVAHVPAGIQVKLVAAFLVIVGLLIAVGTVGLQVLRANNRRASEVMELQQKIAAYQQLRLDGALQLNHVMSALRSPNTATMDAAIRRLDQFGYDFDRLQFLSEGDVERLERVRESRAEFARLVNEAVELIRAGRLDESRELQEGALVRAVDRLERNMLALVNAAEADMVEYDAANSEAYAASQVTVVAFSVGAMALALVLGYALSGSLIGPVRVMAERMRGIASGDFSKHVELPNRDELGEFSSDLNRMNDDLARLHRDRERHIEFLRQTFGRYLSDDVAARLLDSPEGLAIGGEKRKVTLLMSDLRGFTSLSERLPPEQVVSLLNRYLSAMADIILHHQGTINEFIGDAIFVIFGAPEQRDDDAQRAVSCAVAMQLAMADINADNRREGLPEVEMGIGIHTGEVVVGNIGSDKRAKYGVVGRHVNITSRIESFTVGGQILISAAVHDEVGDVVVVGDHAEIMAKGIEEPLVLHDLRGLRSPGGRSLPGYDLALAPLPSALPIQYSVLEGKTMLQATRQARLVRVSAAGGEVESTGELPSSLVDVKIRIAGPDGLEGPCDTVYGKVMARSESSTSFFVRFTSVPPEFAQRLERLGSSAAAASRGGTTDA